jgi:hypothetical protein
MEWETKGVKYESVEGGKKHCWRGPQGDRKRAENPEEDAYLAPSDAQKQSPKLVFK